MSNRIIYSKDSEVCIACEHYDNCDNKRMEMCAAAYLQPPAMPTIMPIGTDITVKHDYRDVKIAENTTITIDLEEVKRDTLKKLQQEIYNSFGCSFLREG